MTKVEAVPFVGEAISERSYEAITEVDLKHFAKIALATLAQAFGRGRVAPLYRDRHLMLVLAQGAASHYYNCSVGLKDVDVWAFLSEVPEKPFPARPIWRADIGLTKFGRHRGDQGYAGRRMDLMGRSLLVLPDEEPEESVRRWLAGTSSSASSLRRSPLVAIWPPGKLGLRL